MKSLSDSDTPSPKEGQGEVFHLSGLKWRCTMLRM